MSCYLRHLQPILKKAGIEVTKENRKEVDKLIHSIVSVEYKHCPDTWKEIKKMKEEDLVTKLKEKFT